jgi:CheY-like chemotaxis protein
MGRSGTGLGLTVVWSTVTDHRGYIHLESEVGKGSSFYLYFPVTLKIAQRATPAVSPDLFRGNSETVLVVDDIVEQREIASEMLSLLGYRPAAVASGEAAIEYLKGNHADLVLLDMIMDPGIDGLETYRRILKIRPQQKVIIVSGYSEADRVEEMKSLGVAQYIKKPYMLEKIGLAIQRELNKQK